MNHKIKKFYYFSQKTTEKRLILTIYQNSIELISHCKISNAFYIVILIIQLLQSIGLSLELSYSHNTNQSTFTTLQSYFRYLHLCNFLTKDNINNTAYSIICYINIALLIMSLFFFFLLSLEKPKYIIKTIKIIISYFYFIDLFLLFPYYISILFSPFKFSYNNFNELPNEPSIEIKALKGINIILLFVQMPKIYMFSFLFNDYSIFNKRLPWSSPFNYITLITLIFKVYLIAGSFLWKNFLLVNIISSFFIIGMLIHSRVHCPFYFHVELNYLTLFNEGAWISFSALYLLLSYCLPNWELYDILFVLVFSIAFGLCYLIVLIRLDSYFIQSFYDKIDYYTQTNKISEYNLYLFLLRMCDVIKKSQKEQKYSNLIFAFYTQHRVSCSNIDCVCNRIEELIIKKRVVVNSNANDEEGELINATDVLEETNLDENVFFEMNKKTNEKHLNLWGLLIETIIGRIDMSGYIKIEYANFVSFYLNKYIHSLIEISYVNPSLLYFHSKFYLYFSKQELIKSNKNLFKCEEDENYFKVLEYNLYYEKFLKVIKKTCEMSINFWCEMQKNIFKPKIIENRGYLICKSATKLEKYSKTILENNPNDIRICKIYGAFLCHIMKLFDEGKALMDKAFLYLVMYIDQVETKEIKKKYDFLDEIECGVIVVNGQKEVIGRVEYVNYSFTNIFGFTKEEIVSKNVSLIMPRNVGKFHNQLMLNFYKTSKPRFLNNLRTEIGLNKEQLIHPVKIYIKIFPCIEEGIIYIGLLTKTTFSNLTNGPIYTRNSIGYIMTNEDNQLIHYNKVIEDRFLLTPQLMHNDSKDLSEIFQLEMIFPELLEKDMKEAIRHEETKVFYTTRVIETMKRMEYSKVWNVLKDCLHDYKEASKNDINIRNSRKNYTISSKDLQSIKQIDKKQFANICVTRFEYVCKVSFLIYQIVFPKGNEQTILNIIKRYQNKFEEMQKKPASTNTDAVTKTIGDMKSVMSAQSALLTFKSSSQRKGNIFAMLTVARKNTFLKSAPTVLKVVTVIFIIKCILVFIEVISEFVLIQVQYKDMLVAVKLTSLIENQFFTLEYLKQAVMSYGLLVTHAIDDSITFNQTSKKQQYDLTIRSYLDKSVKLTNEILFLSQSSSQISALIADSTVEFKTFYEEASYTTTSQSLIDSVTIIVNYLNNLFSLFFSNASDISYMNIIANADGTYYLDPNHIDIQRTVVKTIKTITTNFENNIQTNYYGVISSLTTILEQFILRLDSIIFQLFLVNLLGALIFLIAYAASYVVLINLRTNILLIFTELSSLAIEKCLYEVENFNRHIERIIQDDIFFLHRYYSDGHIDKTDKNCTLTTSDNNNLNNNVDYNLGMEYDLSTSFMQIFNKAKKRDFVSIKEYIEDKKEVDVTIRRCSMVNYPANNPINSSFQKNSDTSSNKGMITFNPNNNSSNLLKKDKDRDSDPNINNYGRNSLISQQGAFVTNNYLLGDWKYNEGNNQNEDQYANENNSSSRDNIITKYKKRAIHKKSQLSKISKFKKKKYFEVSGIIFTTAFVAAFLLEFLLSYFQFKSMLELLNEYKRVLEFNFNINFITPSIINPLLTGEIVTNSSYSNMISHYYSKSKQYLNDHHLFILRYKTRYPALFENENNMKRSTTACSLIQTFYQYGNTALIYTYCMNGFFGKGAEFGTNEFLTYSLNTFNKLLSLGASLSPVEERMKQLNSQALVYSLDYSLYVIASFYSNQLQFNSNYFSKTTVNLRDIFIVKICISAVTIAGVALVFFLRTRKVYLERYIYNKAMVLLIPRNEFVKGAAYHMIESLLSKA